MQTGTVARTGLLLFLTAGPLLVFLFLYFFGKNEFELDRYQVHSPSFPAAYQTKALLLLPSQHLITGTERNAFRNEANRVVKFVSGSAGSIKILRYGLGADTLNLF